MYYCIIGRDHPNSQPLRQMHRPAHLQRLEDLQHQGRLLLAGPFPAIDNPDPGPHGFSGSLIIAEFNDLASATTWAEADPYRLNGIYAEVEIQPFKKTLP